MPKFEARVRVMLIDHRCTLSADSVSPLADHGLFRKP